MEVIKFRRAHYNSKSELICFTYWGKIDEKDQPSTDCFKSPTSISSSVLVIDEQFTGYIDKNNNEIYEGDIIEADWHWQEGFVVDLNEPYFHYAIVEYAIEEDNIEIIGNIHQVKLQKP